MAKRIRVTEIVPIRSLVSRPKVGKVYDVVREIFVNNMLAYIIKVGGVEVTVYSRECQIVDENGNNIY